MVVVCLIFLFSFVSSPWLFATYSVKAESALLMSAETGRILYEKKAHPLFYPASLTKIATSLYALKKSRHQLNTFIRADQDTIGTISEEKRRKSNYTLPAYWLVPGTTHMGIKNGEELRLRDLLYGMMLSSAGDASNVIAKFVGGTIPDFMTNLNIYLKEIGCLNTTFYNPSGTHHPKHKTTAYDLAVMTREALKDPFFREIVKTVRYRRPKTNKQNATYIVQTNRLLKKGKFYYSKAIGVKTGYTSKAGHTLVAVAKHDNRTLIAVLLKSKDRDDLFRDAIKLFEQAFNQQKLKSTLLKKGPQKAALNLMHGQKPIKTYISEDAYIEYYEGEKPLIKCLLYWDELQLPISKDQHVAEYRLIGHGGKAIKNIPLYAQEDVKASFVFRLKQGFNVKWIGAILIALLFSGLLFELRRGR